MGVKTVRVQPRKGSSAILPARVSGDRDRLIISSTMAHQKVPKPGAQTCLWWRRGRRQRRGTRNTGLDQECSHVPRGGRDESDNRDLIVTFKFTRCFQRSTADGQAGPRGLHAVLIVPERGGDPATTPRRAMAAVPVRARTSSSSPAPRIDVMVSLQLGSPLLFSVPLSSYCSITRPTADNLLRANAACSRRARSSPFAGPRLAIQINNDSQKDLHLLFASRKTAT